MTTTIIFYAACSALVGLIIGFSLAALLSTLRKNDDDNELIYLRNLNVKLFKKNEELQDIIRSKDVQTFQRIYAKWQQKEKTEK